MEKGMGVNGERWYIYCGGCDCWWRKMLLRVLQVWCGVWFFFFFFFFLGVRWVMCMGRSVSEGVCSHAYILKGFQIFYFVGCFVIGRLWWLIFHGGKGGIFLMICCRQVLVLVISQVIFGEMFVILGAICMRIRRYWMSSFCFWKKVYGCKFSVLWCPPLHWCNVWQSRLFLTLYIMFLYRHLPSRGHVLLTLQWHWLEGCVVLLMDVIFFNVTFY